MPENAYDECKQQQWISLDETLDMLLPQVDFGHYVATAKDEKQKKIWSMSARGEDSPSRYFGSGIKSVETKTRPVSMQPPRLTSSRQRSNTNPGPQPFFKATSNLAQVTSFEALDSTSKLELA
jgi:hypothetical protein